MPLSSINSATNTAQNSTVQKPIKADKPASENTNSTDQKQGIKTEKLATSKGIFQTIWSSLASFFKWLGEKLSLSRSNRKVKTLVPDTKNKNDKGHLQIEEVTAPSKLNKKTLHNCGSSYGGSCGALVSSPIITDKHSHNGSHHDGGSHSGHDGGADGGYSDGGGHSCGGHGCGSGCGAGCGGGGCGGGA